LVARMERLPADPFREAAGFIAVALTGPSTAYNNDAAGL